MYFLSLGLCIPVLPKVIASTVNDDGAAVITSKSARVAGDVEGVDKLLTFLFVGALGACSDGVGRKPLIALSALGYATTVLVQARATKVAHFFAADAIDGLTSCMNASVLPRRRRDGPGLGAACRRSRRFRALG